MFLDIFRGALDGLRPSGLLIDLTNSQNKCQFIQPAEINLIRFEMLKSTYSLALKCS